MLHGRRDKARARDREREKERQRQRQRARARARARESKTEKERASERERDKSRARVREKGVVHCDAWMGPMSPHYINMYTSIHAVKCGCIYVRVRFKARKNTRAYTFVHFSHAYMCAYIF